MTQTSASAELSHEYPTARSDDGFIFSTKYTTRSRIARRLLAGFDRALDELVDRSHETEVFEVGCGEGYLSLRLARRGLNVSGIDLRPEAVSIAQMNAAHAGLSQRMRLRAGSLYDLGPADATSGLVVCCEVLEHLSDPDRGLDVLAEIAAGPAIVSVPCEPLWRALNLARGRYIGGLGNTPGHVNHWSAGGFVRFLSRRFTVQVVRHPLPWTMVLCRRR